MSTFNTIAGKAEGFYKEKGSKFIGLAIPLLTEDEVKAKLAEIKADHPQARHICYAFRIAVKHELSRSSDGGEPPNSAGPPILGQIRSFGLTNVLVAVVRYFGGTKLGIPGLILAYKEAAADALLNAEIVNDYEKVIVVVEIPYVRLALLKNFINRNAVQVISNEFGESCIFTIGISQDDADGLLVGLKMIPGIQLK